jgi:hypothetical protein
MFIPDGKNILVSVNSDSDQCPRSTVHYRDFFRIYSFSVSHQICGISNCEQTHCWSQRPRGLRLRSAAARLLRLWVRIPPGGMGVCCECCVLSGRGLCDELITCPEESYRLWCVWVWSWSLHNEALAHLGAVAPKKNTLREDHYVFCVIKLKISSSAKWEEKSVLT